MELPEGTVWVKCRVCKGKGYKCKYNFSCPCSTDSSSKTEIVCANCRGTGYLPGPLEAIDKN